MERSETLGRLGGYESVLNGREHYACAVAQCKARWLINLRLAHTKGLQTWGASSRPFGMLERFAILPRVPLRFTLGFMLRPLRGEEFRNTL